MKGIYRRMAVLSENSVHDADHVDRPSDPRQFSLADLFATVTIAALLFALAGPFLRGMQAENRYRLLAVAGIQLLLIPGMVVFAAARRGKQLGKSGKRLGIAYCGEIRWRHWPLFKCSLLMLTLALLQLFLALLLTFSGSGKELSLNFLLFELQLGWFTGLAIARYFWRVYPGGIEFFDRGVCLGGLSFYPWEQVDLRPSQFFRDRIVVVVRTAVGSVDGDTVVAQVTDDLRQRAFAAASAQREC